jgi:hypothetical protein
LQSGSFFKIGDDEMLLESIKNLVIKFHKGDFPLQIRKRNSTFSIQKVLLSIVRLEVVNCLLVTKITMNVINLKVEQLGIGIHGNETNI